MVFAFFFVSLNRLNKSNYFHQIDENMSALPHKCQPLCFAYLLFVYFIRIPTICPSSLFVRYHKQAKVTFASKVALCALTNKDRTKKRTLILVFYVKEAMDFIRYYAVHWEERRVVQKQGGTSALGPFICHHRRSSSHL